MNRIVNSKLARCRPGDVTSTWYVVVDVRWTETRTLGEDLEVVFLRPDGSLWTGTYPAGQPVRLVAP